MKKGCFSHFLQISLLNIIYNITAWHLWWNTPYLSGCRKPSKKNIFSRIKLHSLHQVHSEGARFAFEIFPVSWLCHWKNCLVKVEIYTWRTSRKKRIVVLTRFEKYWKQSNQPRFCLRCKVPNWFRNQITNIPALEKENHRLKKCLYEFVGDVLVPWRVIWGKQQLSNVQNPYDIPLIILIGSIGILITAYYNLHIIGCIIPYIP